MLINAKFLSSVRIVTAVFPLLLSSQIQARPAERMIYEVPKGQFLDQPVHVVLDKARFDLRGSTARFDYQLPAALDGVEGKRFRMSGSFNETTQTFELSTQDSINEKGDPSARASCTGTDKEFDCVMHYGVKDHETLFDLNIAAADAYLQTRTDLSQEQIAQIKTAQFALSHEPIGVVHVRR
jgi:hypothetical protein